MQVEIDSEEILYADFEKQELVYTVPKFVMLDPSKVIGDITNYNDAKKSKKTCSIVVAYFTDTEKDLPDEKGKE